MANGDSPRAATTASIDRRVEKLEDTVNDLQTSVQDLKVSHAQMDHKIDKLEMGQQHLKDIVDARFNTVDTAGQTVNANLNTISTKLDKMLEADQTNAVLAAKYMSDPLATPVGKVWTEKAQDNSKRIDNLEKKVIAFSAGLGVLVFLVNLFAPVIQSLFGLAH